MRNLQLPRAFAWPALLACVLLAGAMLAFAPTASRAQDTGEEWKVDPLRGPVDLGLVDPSLIGAIDIHLHIDPDAPGTSGVIRALDVIEAVNLAKARGMRGFVFKTHQDAGSAGSEAKVPGSGRRRSRRGDRGPQVPSGPDQRTLLQPAAQRSRFFVREDG